MLVRHECGWVWELEKNDYILIWNECLQLVWIPATHASKPFTMAAPAPAPAPALAPVLMPGRFADNPAVVVSALLAVVLAMAIAILCVFVSKRRSLQQPFSMRAILWGNVVTGSVEAYRPSSAVTPSPRSTPARALLIDSPLEDGLDPALVKRLPTVAYKTGKHRRQGSGEEEEEEEEEVNDSCLVCLGLFKEGETLRVLPDCRHLFHAHCVDTWLMERSSCPICRCDISGRNLNNSRLGKLLARFGPGRSFRRSSGRSRSISGRDFGSIPSSLAGDQVHASLAGSQRFMELLQQHKSMDLDKQGWPDVQNPPDPQLSSPSAAPCPQLHIVASPDSRPL